MYTSRSCIRIFDIIEQLIDNIPEGEYYIKQKPIIKVPEGQWYFSVEGVSGEFGVYLDSKGDKSQYSYEDASDGSLTHRSLGSNAPWSEDRRPHHYRCSNRFRNP